jgi:Mce-associated membrane protein
MRRTRPLPADDGRAIITSAPATNDDSTPSPEIADAAAETKGELQRTLNGANEREPGYCGETANPGTAMRTGGTEAVVATRRRIGFRVFAYAVLPSVALIIALGAGFLKWQDGSQRDAQTARIESMQAAKDHTVKLLTYRPDTVENDLEAARDVLTGTFRDSYTQLIHDVVIPGAKQQQISSTATVTGVASVSANRNHAVALVFVDQAVAIRTDPPTDAVSCVRVTLTKTDGRWLISGFDPI